MKYVVVAVMTRMLPPLREYPVLFPDDLVHQDVARGIVRAVEREFRGEAKIVAAGFINHFTGIASGTSESLKLGARPEDTDLIQRFFPNVGRKEAM